MLISMCDEGKCTYWQPGDCGGELPALVGLLLKVIGGGGALGTEGGGLVGGGALAMIVVVPDPGELEGGLEAAGDCGAYQGCRPTDCIQAILSHLIVCQSSLTKPPVSPAHLASEPGQQAFLLAPFNSLLLKYLLLQGTCFAARESSYTTQV